jgi:hypothetical protein
VNVPLPQLISPTDITADICRECTVPITGLTRRKRISHVGVSLLRVLDQAADSVIVDA